jgi:hypothetical protein
VDETSGVRSASLLHAERKTSHLLMVREKGRGEEVTGAPRGRGKIGGGSTRCSPVRLENKTCQGGSGTRRQEAEDSTQGGIAARKMEVWARSSAITPHVTATLITFIRGLIMHQLPW